MTTSTKRKRTMCGRRRLCCHQQAQKINVIDMKLLRLMLASDWETANIKRNKIYPS
jgi:hypothetical protein